MIINIFLNQYLNINGNMILNIDILILISLALKLKDGFLKTISANNV